MFNLFYAAIVFFVFGITMLSAGIYTLRKGADPETKSAKEPDKSGMTNLLFGTNPNIGPKRAGRARITTAVISIIAALVCLAEYYL